MLPTRLFSRIQRHAKTQRHTAYKSTQQKNHSKRCANQILLLTEMLAAIVERVLLLQELNLNSSTHHPPSTSSFLFRTWTIGLSTCISDWRRPYWNNTQARILCPHFHRALQSNSTDFFDLAHCSSGAMCVCVCAHTHTHTHMPWFVLWWSIRP